MNSERGFTLVELLVVVAIVGVLLGVGIMVLHNITDTAQKRADQATVRVLNSATIMLAIRDGKSLETVFDDVVDELGYLVAEEMLENRPEPAQRGVSFMWDSDIEILRWMLATDQSLSLLVNGDWADGLEYPWNYTRPNSPITVENGIARATEETTLFLDQHIDNVEEGASYTLEFKARVQGSITSGMTRIQWLDAAGNHISLEDASFLPWNNWNEWRTFTLTDTAPHGAHTVRVLVFRNLSVEEESALEVRNVRLWKD